MIRLAQLELQQFKPQQRETSLELKRRIVIAKPAEGREILPSAGFESGLANSHIS